ncbi:MAG: prephenate dehydrogenase/arogenate dehydrogenase family protein [Clostridiaceae bacterium]|nr:prephenate dehydrogenase/arogenate dehydrogenase family protein [Clostridiaceae bacterium]
MQLSNENYNIADKQEMTRIAIVGLGLIGGSLARRLSARGCAVTAFDIDASALDAALAQGAAADGAVWPQQRADAEPSEISTTAHTLAKGENSDVWSSLDQCEVVFVCTPPEYVAGAVRLLRSFTNAVITDVASVKTPVMNSVDDLRFVGGHPMAGSEKTGFDNSSESLLENAVYVLCIPSNSSLRVPELKRLEQIIALTGAYAMELEHESHDRAVATISHLPHAAASALCLLAARQGDDVLARLAAGGFRDITRIASSDSRLWAAISLQSGASLIEQIDGYIDLLGEFRQALSAADRAGLERFFYQASWYRESLPTDGRGALSAQSSLNVYVNDRPGELGRITTLLGGAGINIVNIRIREFRAYEGGCLQLLLPDSSQAVRAAWLLREEGYDCD